MTYIYKCCGEQFQKRADYKTCPVCGSYDQIDVVAQGRSQSTDKFEPYWETMLDGAPIYIDSKAHLEREMAKRGVELKKAQRRAPEFARQGSAYKPPTRQQAVDWSKDHGKKIAVSIPK